MTWYLFLLSGRVLLSPCRAQIFDACTLDSKHFATKYNSLRVGVGHETRWWTRTLLTYLLYATANYFNLYLFVFHLSQKLYYRQKMSVPFISRFTTNKCLSYAVPFIKHSVLSTVKAVVCQPDQMVFKTCKFTSKLTS